MEKIFILPIFFYIFQFQTYAQSAYFSSDSPRCVNDTMHFTPGFPGGTILMEDWDFGDGTVNTYLPPTAFPVYAIHVYISPGTYTVLRNVKFSTGILTYSIQVQVNTLPVANFNNTVACNGNSMTFTDMSIANAPAIVSHSWNFGDGGSSTQDSPSHTYSTYGIYNVTLTIINSNGCVNSVTKAVTVYPKPVANFTFPASICFGSPVNFTDLSFIPSGFLSNIISWVWDFGDGTPTVAVFFPSNPNVIHTFVGSALMYNVQLTVTTSIGCISSITKTVTCLPNPIANFFISPTNCANHQAFFTDLSQSNGGSPLAIWNWNFGDPASGSNNISTTQNSTHIFTSPGVYHVLLIVTNTNGCTDTIMKSMIVHQNPTANFTADTVLQGSATTFTDLSYAVSGTIVSRLWDFGDGLTSTALNPSHLYLLNGIYQVKLTVTDNNGCAKDTTKPVYVLFNPLIGPPAARTLTNVIVGNGQTKCYNATQIISIAGNGTLFFVLSGGSVTLIAGQKILFLPTSTIQPGGYLHGYIAPSGPWCISPSMPATLMSQDEVTNSIQLSSFKVYPNPTTGNFILELTGDADLVKLEIYGIWGEKILSTTLIGERRHEFSLSDKPVGVYFIRVLAGDNVETFKIIRQ